jgi:histone H3/H4
MRCQMSALKALQEEAEMYITRLMTGTCDLSVLVLVLAIILIASNMTALHAGRETAMPKDIALVAKLSETMAGYHNYLLRYYTDKRGTALYSLDGDARKGKSIW